jgi:dihydroorotate dehydrogenase electron transfer subunit
MNVITRESAGCIIEQREIVQDHYLMSVEVKNDFMQARPGQFVMIRIKDRDFPFLRRPFSIYSVYSEKHKTIMELLYRVVGRGTLVLSRLLKGDRIEIMGPLGNGFDIDPKYDTVALVAGGAGIAPLSFLAEYFERHNVIHPGNITCYLGARTAGTLVGVPRLRETCSEVLVSTDDGSTGYHGPVTDLVEACVSGYGNDHSMIYACGPRPMVRRLGEIITPHSVACQVSLEERMACGMGACLGCVVEVKPKDCPPRYKRVCKDGPVFAIDEITWN